MQSNSNFRYHDSNNDSFRKKISTKDRLLDKVFLNAIPSKLLNHEY